MPSKPAMPCADCGKMMHRTKGSLPEGQARCRECRRQNAVPGREEERKRRGRRQRYYLDRAAPGLFTPARRSTLLQTWKRQGRRCSYCPGLVGSVDHVIPLVLGGTNHEGNLAPSCIACNSNKGDRLIVEWRLARRVKAERVVAGPPPPRITVAVPTVNKCAACGVLHFQEGEYCSSHRWDLALVGLRA